METAATSSVRTHVQIAAALNIACGAIYVLLALGIFAFFGLVGGFVAAQGEVGAGGFLTLVAMFFAGLMAILGLPSIIAGWGVLKGKEWARILTIVLGVFHLLNFPLGTALGVYSLWVMLALPPESNWGKTEALKA